MYRSKIRALHLLNRLSFFDLIRNFQRKRIAILMYHRFSHHNEPFKISSRVFENQMAFLKKKYNVISLARLSNILVGKCSYPRNPLIVTIDDGYYDNYSIAYPILKKYSIPATIFLTTDFVANRCWLWSNKLEYILKNSRMSQFKFFLGSKEESFSVSTFRGWHRAQLIFFNYLRKIGSKKDIFLTELADYLKVIIPEEISVDFLPLSWENILEMQNNGIHFGSHTCTHPILSTLNKNKLQYEIFSSKREIESRLSREVCDFSYPNGRREDINKDVINVVEDAGYLCAVTTEPGFNYRNITNPFMLKRASISTDDHAVISRVLTSFN